MKQQLSLTPFYDNISNMKKIVIIIFIVNVFNIPFHLKAKPIYGPISCSSYLESFEDDIEWNNVAPIMASWVQGFISGFNSAVVSAKVGDAFSVPEDSKGIAYALLKYCRENPLDNIQDAMLEEIFPTLEHD